MNKIEPKSTWADFFRLVKTVISSKILLVLAIVLNALSSFVTLMIPLFTNYYKCLNTTQHLYFIEAQKLKEQLYELKENQSLV